MNYIELHKYPNLKYGLVINSQTVKEDFTSSTYEDVVSEVKDYIVASVDTFGYEAGVPRLSGEWHDNLDLTISYTTDATDKNFDGTNSYKIKFIDHS